MEDTKKKTHPKRELLLKKSGEAKELRQNMIDGATTAKEALYWQSKTVNYMLLNHVYDTDEATEFNTFKQWKEQGATVKKGSKAFVIFGQPVNDQKQQEAEKKGESPTENDEDYQYFPMCFLFSNKQVLTSEELEELRVKEEKQEEREKEINALGPIKLEEVL
ncbi:MAG: DUF1738 domain-containing protein [Reichenbachiella sp.]